MPTDLDQRLRDLGRFADTTFLAAFAPDLPDRARDRARQRRRRKLTAAGLAVLVLIGAAVAGVVRLRTPPVAPAAPTVHFTALTPLGTGIPLTKGFGGDVWIAGNRAYVGEVSDEGIIVGALDLTTGQPAWATHNLGPGSNEFALFVHEDWLGVLALRLDTLTRQLEVFDTATGAPRWHAAVGQLAWWFDSVVVVQNEDMTGVVAYDARTGSRLWEEVKPKVQYSQNRGSAGRTSDKGWQADPTDHRLLRFGPTGLDVLDARTGALLAHHPGVGNTTPIGAPGLGYQGLVFWADGRGLFQYDLAGQGPPVRISDISDFEYLTTCGNHRICVTLPTQTGGELTVIDTAAARTLFRVPIHSPVAAGSIGDKILVGTGEVLDSSGRKLVEGSASAAGPVTADQALTMTFVRRGPNVLTSRFEVAGISIVDGSRVVLGEIPWGQGRCSWNQQVIICPTLDGIRVWRFAS